MTVEAARTVARHRGRTVPGRALGTPLLVNGLEFDHAIVMNTADLSVHELYVAITRGAKSLRILYAGRVRSPEG